MPSDPQLPSRPQVAALIRIRPLPVEEQPKQTMVTRKGMFDPLLEGGWTVAKELELSKIDFLGGLRSYQESVSTW